MMMIQQPQPQPQPQQQPPSATKHTAETGVDARLQMMRGTPLTVPAWADAIKSDPLCCALAGDVPHPGTPCWNDTEPMPEGRPAFKLPARKDPKTGKWIGLGCFCHPACALRWAKYRYPDAFFSTLASRVEAVAGRKVKMAPDPYFTLRKFCTPADGGEHRHQHPGADEAAGFDVCTPGPGLGIDEYRGMADQGVSFEHGSTCVRAGHVVVFRSVAKPETIAELARRGAVAGPAPRGAPSPGSLAFALNHLPPPAPAAADPQQQPPPPDAAGQQQQPAAAGGDHPAPPAPPATATAPHPSPAPAGGAAAAGGERETAAAAAENDTNNDSNNTALAAALAAAETVPAPAKRKRAATAATAPPAPTSASKRRKPGGSGKLFG